MSTHPQQQLQQQLQPPTPRKHRSHLTLAAGVTATLLLGLAPLLSVQTLPSISTTNHVTTSDKSPASNDWQQFSADIALNAAIIEVESPETSDAVVQPDIGSPSVDMQSDSAHTIPPLSPAEITDPLVEPAPSKLEPVKFEFPSFPVKEKENEYQALVAFTSKSYISNLDLHTASYTGISPYYESTFFLNTPVISGENSFLALARIASYDTGKLVTIPRSHFNLSQPFPNDPSFNPEQAIATAVLDKKYFYECGADQKRDYRYTKPEDCQINNKVSYRASTPATLLHNLQYAQLSVKSLMKAWIEFSQKNSIVWWVSHGELLGWAWNGNLLPWDLDWDLQMTTYQLVQLVAYNQTLIDGRFFIDVNPSIYVRTRQPNNIIDARVIDTWTGYFVDITGVSYLDRTLMNKDFKHITYAWNEVEEQNRVNESDPERVYCKSIHRYSYDELMPLHETMLAGLKVWRPRAALKLIVREYSENALIKEKYEVGYRGEVYAWDRKTAQWNMMETKSETQQSFRWGGIARADEMDTAQVVDQPDATVTATSPDALIPDMGLVVDVMDLAADEALKTMAVKPTKRRILINKATLDKTAAVESGSVGASNKVTTSKYTILSFLPKNLFEQFRSIANFYFMSLVVLQAFPPFMLVSTMLTATPILIIVLATMIKDAVEDWRRHVSDENVNHAKTHKLYNVRNWNFPMSNLPTSKLHATNPPSSSIQIPNADINSIKESMPSSSTFKIHSSYPQKMPGIRASVTSHENPHELEEPPYWAENTWENMRIGDFVYLCNNENIPADVLIISSSEQDTTCYIETKNLDGETNLKIRRGLNEFAHIQTPADCAALVGVIDSELPSANLQTYNGIIQVQSFGVNSPLPSMKGTSEPIKTLSVGMNNMLLRGCILRNTKWAIGIVIYTGADTKIMLNSGITPSKRSKIDRQLNPLVMLNFWLLGAMCLICALISAVYTATFIHEDALFAPNTGQYTPLYAAFIAFFSCLIIFQNIVPISLYISVDVSKTVQSLFINMDLDLYDDETGKFAGPRSWNLSDDLGQIEYIFSDKTGTLTCNMMEFRKCSINGVVYGGSYKAAPELSNGQSINTKDNTMQEARKVMETDMRNELSRLFDTKYLSENLSFVDTVLPRHLQENGEQARKIREFFTLLAVCHTVLVEKPDGDEKPNHIEYRAQSPDEAALVAAARDVGFAFLKRQDDFAEIDLMGASRTYKIMNILEFNSDRKRMSVIIKRPEGQLVLLVKGADSVIFERLAKTEDGDPDNTLQSATAKHLEAFANQGLRTLCLAYKIIPNYEYEAWEEKYRAAQNSVHHREKNVDAAAELIERDLTLMGATAIEDRLQDGVPETIATLSKAGIKIWVLTGDKMETAINIGFSCNLLQKKMLLIVINSTSLKDTYTQLMDALEKFWTPEGVPKRQEKLALIIDGTSLKFALMACCRPLLLEIGCRSQAVICCRVSPLQKARVVSLVRKGLGAMCLAIGDGANDVSMIQEADIGVGISGKEGLQAVMASDYAIGQFRFLGKLLLVHGRWGYVRTAEIIFNYFYKNAVWLFTLLWYQFDCGFSADLITDFTYGMFFNTLFTLFPTMFIGFYEQDLNANICLQVPQIYRKGMKQTVFNIERYWVYMFDALWQSIIAYFFVRDMYDGRTAYMSGYAGDHESMGTMISFICIICTNLHAVINTTNWTYLTFFGLFASYAVWLFYVISYARSPDNASYGQLGTLYLEPHFYLGIIMSVVVALLPRFVFKFAQQYLAPTDSDILLEYQKYQYREGCTISNMDLESQVPYHESVVDNLHTEEEQVRQLDPNSSPLKSVGSDNAFEISRKSEHRVASKAISIHRSQSEKSVAALSERAVLDNSGKNFTVKDEFARLLASRNFAPPTIPYKKNKMVRRSVAGLDDFKIKSPDGFAPIARRRQKSETVLRHSSEWNTIDAMNEPQESKQSPPPPASASRLGVTKTSIFFMGTQEELPNTGFCFSHEEGMTDLIKPSPQSKSRFELDAGPSSAGYNGFEARMRNASAMQMRRDANPAGGSTPRVGSRPSIRRSQSLHHSDSKKK
ncbi:hypothetical protein HDU81_011406 [Chytriomyces hyalinus]|nr:hypothetical protein HDU81_011406 [Chytriomyces hyalinus]